MAVTVDRIARIVVATADVERLAAFYIGTLDFSLVGRDGDDTVLDLGGTRLALRAVASPGERVDAPGWSPRFQHCAIAVADIDAALARLRASAGWTAISTDGPQTLPLNTGGVTAFKFRDPDGHPLELLDLHEAPTADTATFLRIDHTAISVVDVERSIAFYESLGLSVSGRTSNAGVEQARLDGVADAVVDVVALQTASHTAPHLELLGYRGAYDRGAPAATDRATRIMFAGRTVDDHAGASDPPAHDPDGHPIAWRTTGLPRRSGSS